MIKQQCQGIRKLLYQLEEVDIGGKSACVSTATMDSGSHHMQKASLLMHQIVIVDRMLHPCTIHMHSSTHYIPGDPKLHNIPLMFKGLGMSQCMLLPPILSRDRQVL